MPFYEDIVNEFELKKGDRIWLSSSILMLAVMCKSQGEEFDAYKLLTYFKEAIGKEGTILIPTFSFEFSNKGKYDYLHTNGTTGALGNAALNDKEFVRTKHPMHSFAVWGQEQELLCAMDNKHSFGEDSPFAYCKENNIKQIMLGTDYVHAMTFIHYVETMCHVPYRFSKTFTGIYITRDGREETRTYNYAARDLSVKTEEKFNRIGSILEERGIAKVYSCYGCVSRIVPLGESYDIIRKDILYNQCRNIYDFNVPRKKIFENYGG